MTQRKSAKIAATRGPSSDTGATIVISAGMPFVVSRTTKRLHIAQVH